MPKPESLRAMIEILSRPDTQAVQEDFSSKEKEECGGCGRLIRSGIKIKAINKKYEQIGDALALCEECQQDLQAIESSTN